MLRIFFAITALFLSLAQALAQDNLVPAFKLQANDLELSRLAQPGTYFDKAGSKFAILGFESGSFEAWAYPLKLFRNFEFSFLLGSSTEPIKGKDIVRFISVTPEATTLTYTYQSFAIRAIYLTPVSEPGAIILLEVDSTEPLTIICSFLPVLQPMWPAGIGGQYAHWDNGMKAYLISESSRMNHGYLGSPAASGISYTPAHMLSDVPNQFKIEIKDVAAVKGKYIPIIMAGGKGKRDEIKTVYQKLAAQPEQFYQQNVAYYRRLQEGTLQVITPQRELNLAFEWAKIAYDNLRVDHPTLGKGLVAGLGASGTSGRPGFGWFFGGDAYINSFSMNSYGAFETVKEALAFTQKWQRDDGKMAHELSQAEGYINWFKDYHYGYIHGDTTPFYLCAMYDYLTMTGDEAFIKNSWRSIRRAYEWCLSTDANRDGLMDNSKAGLGALEFGSLTNIATDIYLAAVWVRAAWAMSTLAQIAGEKDYAPKAQRDFEKAQQAFNEKFWDDKLRQYSYAFNAQGEHVAEVSPWAAVGLMWNLADPRRSALSLEKLNSSELTTDWGVRSISIKSRLFEPLNYNYGAVWPFLTSWVATAQYQHHFALPGYNSLMASVRHTFDNALGFVTEVFSGYHNSWPQEAVAHQGFCSAGVVLPLVRGMLGLDGNALRKRIHFAPQLPADWPQVTIRNYQVGKEAFSFHYEREISQIKLTAKSKGIEPYTLQFAPALGMGSEIRSVFVNGIPANFLPAVSAQTMQPVIEFTLTDSAVVLINFEPYVEILPPVITTKTGDTNKGLKIISTHWQEGRLTLTVEGLAGENYELGIVQGERIQAVHGAQASANMLVMKMPDGAAGEFVKHEIVIETK